MHGGNAHTVGDGTEMEDEIQPAVGEAILDIQASTSDVAETRVACTLETFLGVTEENHQLQKIVYAMRITEEEHDTDENRRQTYKIQKVPEIMRKNRELEEYFKPRQLSIGPIHATDWKLNREELKLQLAAYFLNEIRKKRADSGLFTKFESRMQDIDINMFFEVEVIKSYNSNELMSLLFLDGCAILGFAKAYLLGILNKFNISTGQAALIRQDLFLLENQIPFQVLEELINLTDKNEIVWLEMFIITSNSTFPRDLKKTSHVDVPEPGKDSVHLLDIVRREFLVVHNHDSNKFFKRLFSFGEVSHTNYGMNREQSNEFDKLSEYWKQKHFFRKIRELQVAGINFKPTDSLRDISFHSQFSTTGQLVLPTLVVDNLTPCMLMNLVAYELCLSNTNAYNNSRDAVKKSWVTSYVNLLDLLIDDEQDVKDLRAAGILRNCLSSDSDVAQLINTVGSYCFAPPEDMYEHVKYQIGRHCRKRSAVWMSQVYRTHFSSPWSILALIAAIVVLGLTAAQTYYAVHPNS